MTVKSFFTNQEMNRVTGKILPGTAASWSTSDNTREVILSATALDDIYPSALVKIDETSAGEKVRVLPCENGDAPYGMVLFNTKNYVHNQNHNVMTIARRNIDVFVAVKTETTAGEAIYFDPTDGLYTNSSAGTIKVGVALQTLASAVPAGQICRIEVQMPNV